MSKNYQTIETSLKKEVVGITLPTAFEVYTKQLFGEERYNIFFKGLQQSSSVSIRLNPFKTSGTTQITNSFEPIPIAWCKEGFYLNVRPNFTFDPLFHAGAYYVQEASSMFLSHVLRHLVKKPVALLDLCAAPGGKTTCARTAISDGSIVFSNEPINKRAQILAENVQKFGHSDVVVTNNYPRDYKKTKLSFDVIVADVPCSGEGMFRKDPQAIAEWSEQNVENCWKLQRSIIADIWDNLKPGGLLIYSTCTFNAHENEENVAWILSQYDAKLLEVPTENTWNITGSLINNPLGEDKPFPVYRFIPGFTQGEGLFMAIIKKGGTSTNVEPNAEKLVAEANKKLKVMVHGVKQDTIKGKKIIPDHSLALAINGDRSSYPNVEIDYETAIKYLRHEAIMLSAVAPKGIVTLTYRGHAIGFANNLGNRANNLYPQEWRIKSSHIPNEQIILT
jgi:NOL1/NOP2/sun family protein